MNNELVPVLKNQLFLIFQTMRRVKTKQLKKYKEAKTDEEKAQIELDPMVIFHKAIENSKPLFLLYPVARGGIKYQVSCCCCCFCQVY